MKNITYAIDLDTGLTMSRVGNEIAFWVLDYESMKPENNFQGKYHLKRGNIHHILPHCALKWTKKMSIELKNQHRKFWGFKSLN